MPKRYFAATYQGKTYFRASDTRVYQSLTFTREGGSYWGMSAKPGPIAVREIDKAEYLALVARKAERIAVELADIKAENPGREYRGYGSEPTASWVDAT